MSTDLANKIAAGEVVEKCMNIVKELVENSVDANSSSITIDLLDGGIKKISVTDDGDGMDRKDAQLAFLRHATSKIKDIDDLFYISSLGFRGEALPSIASISKMNLITSNEIEGTNIKIEGGEILDISNAQLVKGTKVTVEDLFYNTPVRLKYLKNQYSELANIVEYINKMALSYPNIKWTLTNNSKTLFKTTGNGDLLKVIYDIYGAEVAKKMIEISADNDDYSIYGYISYPEVTKSFKNAITILINGRVIKNNDIVKVISKAYHTYIHEGRYPIVVINIDVDPILIDVNIHPTKQDIKFSKFNSLSELLLNSIDNILSKRNLIPDAYVRDNISEVNRQINNQEEIINNYEEVKLDFSVGEDKTSYQEERTIKEMTPIGIIDKTFIVAYNEDGMYLIDQHAIAERINYEKLVDSMTKEDLNITTLAVPMKFEFTKDEAIKISKKLDDIKALGIDIEEFGDNTFIVREHPTWLTDANNYSLKKIFDIIISDNNFDKKKFIDKAATSMACHMSVKAHTYISLEEAKYLLDNIRYCNNPFTCPHGRPTIIAFSKDQLIKMFKRDYNE